MNPLAQDYFLNYYAVPMLAAGLMVLILGAVQYIREGYSRVSLAFVGVCSTAAIWLINVGIALCAKTEEISLFWNRIEHVGVFFIPCAVYTLTLTVVNRLQEKIRSVLACAVLSLLFVVWLLSTDAFITGFYSYPWGLYAKYGPASVLFLSYFFVAMAGSLWLYTVELKTSSAELQKQRVRALRGAFLIGYLGSIDFIPTYGIPIPPLGFVPVVVFVILIARIMTKYRLVTITPAFAAKNIMDTMTDALLVSDREGIIRLMNPAAASLFKKSETEMLGKRIFDVCPGFVSRDRFYMILAKSVHEEFETTVFPAPEEAAFLSVTASLLFGPHRQVDAVTFIARNISHRKKIEAQFRHAQKAETLSILAGSLAKDVSDELNTGLSALDQLRQSLDSSDAVYSKLADIQSKVERSLAVSRKILDFSVASAEYDILSIDQIFRNLDSWLPKFLPVRILSDLSVQPDLWRIYGNQTEVESVLMHVIANSKEAMPNGGRLLIRAGNTVLHPDEARDELLPGAYVLITVRDTGCGLSKEIMNRVFEPFFTTKSDMFHAGLGLSTVRQIVKDYRGYMDVRSEEGKGATVSIYLPALMTLQTSLNDNNFERRKQEAA